MENSWRKLVHDTTVDKSTKRGLFVVVEGCDRAGKSTQVKEAVRRLNEQGVSAIEISFPARETPIGGVLSAYLRDTLTVSDESIHLLFSANRWECCEKIVRTLLEGTTVVCDRYSFSGVAYSAAKGLDRGWCENADRGLVAPDLIFYLDVPLDVAASRSGFGEERYEKLSFQASVRRCFESMKAEHFAGSLGSRRLSWLQINGNATQEEVAKNINSALRRELGHENSMATRPFSALYE